MCSLVLSIVCDFAGVCMCGSFDSPYLKSKGGASVDLTIAHDLQCYINHGGTHAYTHIARHNYIFHHPSLILCFLSCYVTFYTVCASLTLTLSVSLRQHAACLRYDTVSQKIQPNKKQDFTQQAFGSVGAEAIELDVIFIYLIDAARFALCPVSAFFPLCVVCCALACHVQQFARFGYALYFIGVDSISDKNKLYI